MSSVPSQRDEESGPWLSVARDQGAANCTAELIDDFYAREDSMEITNDPRFFSGNVIDKRLKAFGSVGIISGFMISVTFSELNGMDKDIDFPPWLNGWKSLDHCFQLLSFGILTYALFCNLVATFVAVAQTYYTYRLMTAGPTGFEMATKFYLDAYITWWRHYAIKHVLVSLPLLVVGHGARMMRKFDTAHHAHVPSAVEMRPNSNVLVNVGNMTGNAMASDGPEGAVFDHSVYGFIAMLVYFMIGGMLMTVHWAHKSRFADFYESMNLQGRLQRGGGGSQRNMRPEI